MPRISKAFPFYCSILLLNIVVLGVLTGTSSRWWMQKTDVVGSASVFATNEYKPKKHVKNGVPIRLEIPSLGMNLIVQRGSYQADGDWTLDNEHAFFALPSVPVNTHQGTTLIYGHNIKSVFKDLELLTPGAKLIITTENNLRFFYEYSFVSEVSPDNTSVFNNINAPNVTLQTCSGPWDELRSMYTFTFQSVKNNE